jgi:hypothetical protein
VVLVRIDDTFGVTGTKICDLEYRGIRGIIVRIAKHEDVCRLDVLMKSVSVREQTGILIGDSHYSMVIVV